MIKLLHEICAIPGVSGDEEKVRNFIINLVKSHVDSYEVDNIGNLICFKKGGKTPKNKLMICAHMDEVGFIIKSITDDGMLKFGCVGGVDTRVIIGRRLKIGDVSGVVGIKAVHLTTAEMRKTCPSLDELYIDIGASCKKDAEKLVCRGDYAVFDSEIIEFGDGFIKAKALDDRFGCALMIEMIRGDIEFDTYFSFNVQEEAGLRGALVSAYNVNPDIAVVLETTTAADIPGVDGHMQVCKQGDGVVITFMDRSTIYSEEMYKSATDLADKHGIKWQTKSLIAGGNDSGAIHKTRSGIRVIAFSAPTRYLHTASCVAKISDLFETQKMLEVFMKEGCN